MAIILAPHGKVYSVKLDMAQSKVVFEGGWSQFVVFHGITETDFLLLRYEGNNGAYNQNVWALWMPNTRKSDLNKVSK